MIEYTRGGVIDDHTRFLMRFNGNFKVEGESYSLWRPLYSQ